MATAVMRVLYRSGNSIDVTCEGTDEQMPEAKWENTRTPSGVPCSTLTEWKQCGATLSPQPLFIGLHNVEAIYQLSYKED